MNELLMFSITGFWVGLLSSISPCPLSTNIAMISFVTQKLANKLITFLSGLLYAIGRSLSYILICFIVVKAFVGISSISNNLQNIGNQILGIIMIVAGMALLDLIRIKIPGLQMDKEKRKKYKNLGLVGSLLLGMVFALAFCPISAAIFFGTVIPISIKANSALIVPLLFGIGTAVPVLAFAILTVLGSNLINRFIKDLSKIEKYMRIFTGVVFILVGVYLVATYVFRFF
ncbi:MAG: aromatic aminobenezylarsenical efflux permease ArsG family transporter [Myxococcota bacterium]